MNKKKIASLLVLVMGLTGAGIAQAEPAADAKAETVKLKADLKDAKHASKMTAKGELAKLREKQKAERKAKKDELKAAKKETLAQKREALKKAKGEWKSAQVKKKLRSQGDV